MYTYPAARIQVVELIVVAQAAARAVKVWQKADLGPHNQSASAWTPAGPP